MNTENLMRRYWAVRFNVEQNDKFEKFIQQEKWQIEWNEEQGKQFYQKLNEVKIGDFFALKALEAENNANISALGIVFDTSERSSGELKVKWLKCNHLNNKQADFQYWNGIILEIKRKEDIAEIFKPLFEPSIESQDEQMRTFTSNSGAFDFWKNESEDIYQDYLKTS